MNDLERSLGYNRALNSREAGEGPARSEQNRVPSGEVCQLSRKARKCAADLGRMLLPVVIGEKLPAAGPRVANLKS